MIVLSIIISVDKSVGNNQWWKELFSIFASPGEYFEIHCWKHNSNELQTASQFGENACFGMPNLKVINGEITQRFIDYLMNETKPEDSSYYNKMVPFYIIHIGDHFSSEDYGTRIILKHKTKYEKEQFEHILKNINATVKNTDKRDFWRIL